MEPVAALVLVERVHVITRHGRLLLTELGRFPWAANPNPSAARDAPRTSREPGPHFHIRLYIYGAL